MQLPTAFPGVSRATGAPAWVRKPLLAFVATRATGSCLSAQTLDAFDPLPQAAPTTFALQAGGRILLGGYFLDIASSTLIGVQCLTRMVRRVRRSWNPR